MDYDEAYAVLSKVLSSGRVTAYIKRLHLSESNFTIDKLERVSFNFGVVKNKEPKLTWNISFMFGFTGRNNPKIININDISEEKIMIIVKAWTIYAKDKLSRIQIDHDIGI